MKQIWPNIELPDLYDYEPYLRKTAVAICRKHGVTLFELKGKGRAMLYVKARREFVNELHPEVPLQIIARYINRNRTTMYNLLEYQK